MYQLKVSDNNHSDVYGPFNSKAELVRERTQLIKAYNYDSKHGFKRSSYDDMVIFKHAIYSSVIFETLTN